MLTSTQILNNIDEIVERAYLDFTFDLIGEEFLTDEQKIQVESLGLIVGRRPLIETLYILARQRATPGYREDKTLNQVLSDIARTGVLPVINDESQYTIDHAKADIDESLSAAKEKLKKDIKRQILTANTDHKEELTLDTTPSVPARIDTARKNANSLLKNLTYGAIGLGVVSTFNRDFTTALTNTMNSAAVDEIRTQAMQSGLMPGGTQVYKQIVDDNRTSPECRELHTWPDGTPRVYPLAQVQGNGTNIGKPRSQWRIVVGGTHPNCRCTMKIANQNDIKADRKKRGLD